MSQEHRILTEEMAGLFDRAMLMAGNSNIATHAAIADSTGAVGCHVFVVPACMFSDINRAIDAHVRSHKRRHHAGDN